MKTITTFRSIKREIKFTNSEYDTMVKRYLLENMWYRRKVYNIGVEYIRQLEENNANSDTKKYFNRFEWDTLFHYDYESEGKPLHEEFKTKVKGIRAMVARNLDEAYDKVWKHRKENKINAKLHFCKYNRNYQSFGVENKYRNPVTKKKRMLSVNSDGIHLKFQCRGIKSIPFYINLTLKESIYSDDKYFFNELDITEVHFVYDAGKWFIVLPSEVTLIKYKDKNRMKLAGIDEGERNSIALYNGNDGIMLNILNDRTIQKLLSIQKRIEKLQYYMDNKVYQSNNYKKTQDRLNKLYRKKYNIIHDRRKKLACLISKSYKNLIVDEFNVPIITKHNKTSEDNVDITTKVKKKINKKMHLNSMGYFKEDLITACISYNTNYYKALPNTTRKCSCCGYINEPLPLKKKYLLCEKCGTKIHRDENASINCYNQYDEIDKYYDIHIQSID